MSAGFHDGDALLLYSQIILAKLWGPFFSMIKTFKKIKKEETSSEETLKSQLMKKFRLSLLGSVSFQMK